MTLGILDAIYAVFCGINYTTTVYAICDKYTVFGKKVVHQAHIDNLVNSQRIFKILSLAHSVENLI